MTKIYLLSKSLLFFILVKWLNSLPHDICFEKFDGRDCKGPPKQVFYYYQKGSRCETKMWRGCPTLNKFDNEFECSNLCIGKIFGENQESSTTTISEIDTCKGTLNQADCGQEHTVYTYKKGQCVKEDWHGCDTLNKFEDEKTCIKTCASDKFTDELKTYNLTELKAIETILDKALEPKPVKKTEPKPLKDPEPKSLKDPEPIPLNGTEPIPLNGTELIPLKGPEPEPLPEPSSSSNEDAFDKRYNRTGGSFEEVVTA